MYHLTELRVASQVIIGMPEAGEPMARQSDNSNPVNSMHVSAMQWILCALQLRYDGIQDNVLTRTI